eukprot:119652-Pyramimonas_sp.AAC.1
MIGILEHCRSAPILSWCSGIAIVSQHCCSALVLECCSGGITHNVVQYSSTIVDVLWHSSSGNAVVAAVQVILCCTAAAL